MRSSLEIIALKLLPENGECILIIFFFSVKVAPQERAAAGSEQSGSKTRMCFEVVEGGAGRVHLQSLVVAHGAWDQEPRR
jgi:hypothetical protein